MSVGAIDPVGITNASTTNARKTNARINATRIDSIVSLMLVSGSFFGGTASGMAGDRKGRLAGGTEQVSRSCDVCVASAQGAAQASHYGNVFTTINSLEIPTPLHRRQRYNRAS